MFETVVATNHLIDKRQAGPQTFSPLTTHPAKRDLGETPTRSAEAPLQPARRDPFAASPEIPRFSAREEAIVIAIARAVLPNTTHLPGGGPATLERLYRFMRGAPASWPKGFAKMLWAVELASVPVHGQRFASLDLSRAQEFLEKWTNSSSHLKRSILRAVISPIKYAHFDSPDMFEHVGCRYETEVVKDEKPRWLSQVIDGRAPIVADSVQVVATAVGADSAEVEFEAEIVVVGTGAGGAAAAYELTRRGHAVLMVEEGDYHRRGSFNGRANEMTKLLYRDMGLTIALGNVGIPVWAGRAVGGSTTINSGTCYRAPERVFHRWRQAYGLSGFSEDTMAPYYERVEAMLQVAPAKQDHLGGVGAVVARGARKLGMLHHGAIRRNAPDCDGQGICCFGCPTGAKRSTDVSYVPEALKRGAQVLTGAKVTRVEIVHGRARAVVGLLANGRRFRVRASAVVLAGGSLQTPGLLQDSGLNAAMIGRNLSIHPATKVLALFDEKIDQSRGIPQGYAISDLAAEGIMFEGGSTPFDITGVGIPFVGPQLMELMAKFPQLATFGLMVQDTARGSVRRGPGGRRVITYSTNAYDLGRLQRGVVRLSELFLAAGAQRVFPFVAGSHEIRNQADIDRLASRKLTPGDIETTAFHPLGTARIGTDPRYSVLRPDHETHEVAGLYVMDGAAVPSSLGVNPQMTIMAMALRAAEGLSAKLTS